MGNLDFIDDLDDEFDRQVARLNHLQSQALPEPARPVALVCGEEPPRWFVTFSEAARFARGAYRPGAYAIRNLTDPPPFVPMVTIKN
jgi:hypothetical protein